MLLKLFFLGWFALAQQAVTTCGNSTVAQTPPLGGPGETVAILKVSSEDDRAKDTHLCMADYQLLITTTSESKPQPIELLTSDNDWGRPLSIQLSGFSQDGKRIFGVLSEGGASPVKQVFDYNRDDGIVRLFDLTRVAAQRAPAKCLSTAAITGTADDGGILIRLNLGKDCTHSSLWILNSESGPLQPLRKRTAVQELYTARSNAE
jgi:hypothetical protein